MSFEDNARATFRRGDSAGVLRMARVAAHAAAVAALGDARFATADAALENTEVFGLTWPDAPGR